MSNINIYSFSTHLLSFIIFTGPNDATVLAVNRWWSPHFSFDNRESYNNKTTINNET